MRRKEKKLKETVSDITLNSYWMTPIAFFSLLVRRWEVWVFVSLTVLAVLLLIGDIICQIKLYPYKSRRKKTDEVEAKAEPDSDDSSESENEAEKKKEEGGHKE